MKIAFLETDVFPNARGDFATGKALFDEMLREEHLVDYDADALIQTGWEQLRLTRELMAETARQIDPHKTVKEMLEALHEAYPGHHLQLVWANRHVRIPRRMGSFLSTLLIEGWAFYCEELMEQLGYIGEPLQRLGRLSDQLWRAARIILDVSLHTRDERERGGRFPGERVSTRAHERPRRGATLHQLAHAAPVVFDGQAGDPGTGR